MSIAENEKIWVTLHCEDVFGPVSATEIRLAFREQKLNSDTFVWKKGWNAWKSVTEIPLFKIELKGNSASKPPPAPSLRVPSLENFESIITPVVSASDLSVSHTNWDARRLAWVGGSYLLAGPLGAVVSTVLTNGSVEERRSRERTERLSNADFIPDKNKA